MKKDKNVGRQEVEYKQKAGTAWSHSYLNQKPWHPLSYPNQRRKWIAEQTHAQREQQAAEVAREFAQEQDFFRQTAHMTKKEKEKLEQMQAVSFMYIRPPGYNAEAARAAEIADERKRLGLSGNTSSAPDGNASPEASERNTSTSGKEVAKARVKDVFGRTLPTEEEFPALKNAPRLETGAPVRLKPFAIEIRNVMCARCGAYGHQSGDRECTLKDKLMPNEEARLKREDPLNVILAQTSDEPLKWELKQQPGGLSPARGGFKPDDPNQQIIPDEDIYDQYGGFLAGAGEDGGLSIPSILASLSRDQGRELIVANIDGKDKRRRSKKKKKKHKHREKRGSSDEEQLRRRHQGKKRGNQEKEPGEHGGDSERKVSSSSSDEDRRNSSSSEGRKKRYRAKRRRAKRENMLREESSSGGDDERRNHGSDEDERRKRRRHKRRTAKSQGRRKKERTPEESGTDEDKRAQKHRRRKNSGRIGSEDKRDVPSDRSDDDSSNHSTGDEEKRVRHQQKRRVDDQGDEGPKDFSSDESKDDEDVGRRTRRRKIRAARSGDDQKTEFFSDERDDDYEDTKSACHKQRHQKEEKKR